MRTLQVAEEYLVEGQSACDVFDGNDISHHAGRCHGPRRLGFILAPKPNTEVVVPALTRFCTYTVAPIGRQGGSPSNRWSIVGIGMERCT